MSKIYTATLHADCMVCLRGLSNATVNEAMRGLCDRCCELASIGSSIPTDDWDQFIDAVKEKAEYFTE